MLRIPGVDYLVFIACSAMTVAAVVDILNRPRWPALLGLAIAAVLSAFFGWQSVAKTLRFSTDGESLVVKSPLRSITLLHEMTSVVVVTKTTARGSNLYDVYLQARKPKIKEHIATTYSEGGARRFARRIHVKLGINYSDKA